MGALLIGSHWTRVGRLPISSPYRESSYPTREELNDAAMPCDAASVGRARHRQNRSAGRNVVATDVAAEPRLAKGVVRRLSVHRARFARDETERREQMLLHAPHQAGRERLAADRHAMRVDVACVLH